MYNLQTTRHFDKDVKRCEKRGLPMRKLREAMLLLKEAGTLPARYLPHKLSGDYAGRWECHLQPDWLLVWEQRDDELILLLTNTGSHADIFK